MKRLLYILTAAVLFCTGLVSCDDEKESYPPTFKGFLYSPKTVHAGDSVTIKACYASPGNLVYLVGNKGYTWTLTLDTLNEDGVPGQWSLTQKPYCSIGDGEPTWKCAIPKTANPGTQAKVTFLAEYSNAATGAAQWKQGCPTQEGYYGRFDDSYVTSPLYSRASGSLTFVVLGKE